VTIVKKAKDERIALQDVPACTQKESLLVNQEGFYFHFYVVDFSVFAFMPAIQESDSAINPTWQS
jgi:hypothetical protein